MVGGLVGLALHPFLGRDYYSDIEIVEVHDYFRNQSKANPISTTLKSHLIRA